MVTSDYTRVIRQEVCHWAKRWNDSDKSSRRPRRGLRLEITNVDRTKRRIQDFRGQVMKPKTKVLTTAIAVCLLAAVTMARRAPGHRPWAESRKD